MTKTLNRVLVFLFTLLIGLGIFAGIKSDWVGCDDPQCKEYHGK